MSIKSQALDAAEKKAISESGYVTINGLDIDVESIVEGDYVRVIITEYNTVLDKKYKINVSVE